MAGFTRYFTSFPGYDVIAEIESVNIVEITPPGVQPGAGTGVVLLVGEFERGSINMPKRVYGGADIYTKYGGLGLPVGSNPHAGPIAVRSGGNELWNGNGYVWISRKRFSGLILCRVDSSAGSVSFTRNASLLGGEGPYSAAHNGTITFLRNGTTTVTATVTGTAATITGVSGTFPTTFTGGEWLEVRTRRGVPSRVIEFTAAHQTNAQVRDRINAVLALPIADLSGGQLRLSSEVAGADGYIEVVGGTARATLGLPTAAVQQVQTWTVTATTAGDYTISITLNVDGVLTDYEGTVTSDGSELNPDFRDDLVEELANLGVPGVTFAAGGGATFTATADANVSFTVNAIVEPNAGDVTTTATTAAVRTIQYGLGNVGDITTIQRSEAIVMIDALTGMGADSNADGLLRVFNTGTPSTGTLQVTGGSAASAFGFDTTIIADAGDAEAVTIPAGTRVQDSSVTGTVWVTMEDIDTGTGGGSWSSRVRPYVDTDTAEASTSGNVTLILDTLADSFTVTNAGPITRLSAAQLDVRYQTALDATLDENSEARRANIVCSARSSERIMAALKENGRRATAAGLSARKVVMRPLLGTSLSAAQANTGQGVGNTQHSRTDRVVYCYPGVKTYVPEIAEVGADVGGVGFTDDGVINVGADSFYASLRSQFNPEENVGQDLNPTVGPMPILAMEDQFDPEADDYAGTPLNIEVYKAFKRAGIAAPRIDVDVGAVFQSDITSVDPAASRVLAPANRRYMADYVIDTMATIGKRYVKTIGSVVNRQGVSVDAVSFFDTLLSRANPQAQRIAGYTFTPQSTRETEALGVSVWELKVKMLPTQEALLFNVQVGTTVQIEEQ